MRFFSSFFRLLAGLRIGRPPSGEQQTDRIRAAMLSLLEVHNDHSAQRLAQRVRFAGEVESLWYLRQELLSVLSERDGKQIANRQMTQVNRLFKGGLPRAMGPRVHHRFPA